MKKSFFPRVLAILLVMLPGITDAKVIHVSSSLGNDKNPGTESLPMKTIEQALSKCDSVLLRAGDVFYGTYTLNKKYLG